MEISVVIPVYNRSKMMEKALESLKNQTYKKFEVIIIDDGSKDDLLDTIEKYKEFLDIKYYYLEHSGNIAVLRNYGLNRASGKYIAVLDSDDQCMPERLEQQYNYMCNNQNIDILATWVSIEDDFKNDNTSRLECLYNFDYNVEEMISRFLNDGCCICNSTVMMKKNKIIQLGGYDESMYICEDFNLWIRALINNYYISIMHERLVVRKLHKNSLTEGYNGSSTAIRMVLKNKMQYLKAMGKLKRKIYIWGKNTRTDFVLDEMRKFDYGILDFEIIDIYRNVLPHVDKNGYHLITSYSRCGEIFDYLENRGLKKVVDYIYL